MTWLRVIFIVTFLVEATGREIIIDARHSSKYKGVTWNKDMRKWRTKICINSKVEHLGYFADEKEAAMAYDKAAKKLRGEFALLNNV